MMEKLVNYLESRKKRQREVLRSVEARMQWPVPTRISMMSELVKMGDKKYSKEITGKKS